MCFAALYSNTDDAQAVMCGLGSRGKKNIKKKMHCFVSHHNIGVISLILHEMIENNILYLHTKFQLDPSRIFVVMFIIVGKLSNLPHPQTPVFGGFDFLDPHLGDQCCLPCMYVIVYLVEK